MVKLGKFLTRQLLYFGCRPSSAMLPTIVDNAADDGQQCCPRLSASKNYTESYYYLQKYLPSVFLIIHLSFRQYLAIFAKHKLLI